MAKMVGQGILRREDYEILKGEAEFVDDLELEHGLWIAMVRSHVARARIVSISTKEALKSPGVVAVYTGKDLFDLWALPMFVGWSVPGIKSPHHYPLATDIVNYVGEGIAVVVAKTRFQAIDATYLVHADYDYLPPVLELEDSLSDREIIHEALETNVSYIWNIHPHETEVDEAFATADIVVTNHFVQQRLIPASIEPRGVVVIPKRGSYSVYSATQIPHILRFLLAITLRIPETKIRVIAPSVGGAFGSKLNIYPEEVLCLALARKLNKPIRWREMRSENSMATTHGRGQNQTVSLAADSNGKIKAVRADIIADMGAYHRLLTPAIAPFGGPLLAGVYDIPLYSYSCTAVFTNKTPTDAYRGAGRPEASYAIERSIDELAAKLGMDPAEIRRINFLPPFFNGNERPSGITMDSGNYEPALNKALELVEYSKLREEQKKRRNSGATKHLGIGISSYMEMCGLAPSHWMGTFGAAIGGWESSTVRVQPTGKVEVITGTSPHGQGHETSWAQIVSDKLGIPMEDIEVFHSDTAISPHGMDTYGSRSLSVGGSAVSLSCDKILAKAALFAEKELGAPVEFIDGSFTAIGVIKRMTIAEVALVAYTGHNLPPGVEANLTAETTFNPPNFTYPFGTHICVVEVDEETGQVYILKYVGVDDCGNRVNPMIVEGQLHGGIVQGLAQALFEGVVYDEDGNLLTATFLDYTLPYASEMISFSLDSTITPSPSNPLGTKGVGEAGTIAAAQAAINAVVDALRPLGVVSLQMPASPQKVYWAIQDAKNKISSEGNKEGKYSRPPRQNRLL